MKKNAELKVGDRVWLIHMQGEPLYDIEGVVTEIVKVPKRDIEDSGIMYKMKWFDKDNDEISKLPLLPQTDKWLKLND
jgi:hypothetical protein